MATAQEPNLGASSRKKVHLEAGKRRLEEFRKKKAAERAKKVATTSQVHAADAKVLENHTSETERVQQIDSDGAVTSDLVGETITKPSHFVIDHDINATELVHRTDLGSSNKYEEFGLDDVSSGSVNVDYSFHEKGINGFGTLEMPADGITTEQITSFQPQSVQDLDSNFSHYGKTSSGNSDDHFKDFTVVNPGTNDDHVTNVSSERSTNILQQNKSGSTDLLTSGWTSSYEDSVRRSSSITDFSSEVGGKIDGRLEYANSSNPYMGELKLSSSVGNLTSANNPSFWPSESRPTISSFDAKSSSYNILQSSPVAGTNTRRSRPSFLDSINMPRVSSDSVPITEPAKADSFSSKVHPININGGDLFRHGVNQHNIERKHEFRSAKQDEDFAALEQHIEDLTQEKFSLQRAIEASRTLAESLAAENSALTDSYNQQGSVVHQLKSDMEKLQEEIKGQLVELESMKIEYTNVQLECNAADERAKLLASEVIGLEEKALRLRSSELKLERQLENSQAEISSFKNKISSLEKDRQDLQLTINALQEEKKLLQSKLRKASASGKFASVSTSSTNKRNVSTSTEDLADTNDVDDTPGTSNLETSTSAPFTRNGATSFNLEDLSLYIPPDQMRMVQNINTLISELGLEKEELMQALSAESSQSSMLKELNKELSRQLEVQTQRLELLTAQSMANESIPARQTESRTMNDNAAYADEGDEVVERVLGWLMKLFPGGPSRRRTSKLL
ncbi:hypothetical protein LguiA_030419 [Lonicera macranthoides]